MRIKEIVKILSAEVILKGENGDIDVEMGCGSDLMSDVLSSAKPGAILLTGLTTLQAVYTGELMDIKAICFVRGKKPPEETVRLAMSRGMILLSTNLPMFESCGRLYEHGLKGCSEHEEK